jgi:hypothetical protein
MTGYTVLAGALIFFLLFIYATWFGTQLKLEKQKDKGPAITINPYDNILSKPKSFPHAVIVEVS